MALRNASFSDEELVTTLSLLRRAASMARSLKTSYPPMSVRSKIDELFNLYYRELNAFVVRKFGRDDDSEDVIQDTFHSLLRNVDVDSLENPRAYLYKAASNIALNRIRSSQRDQSKLESFAQILDIECENGISPELSTQSQQQLRQFQAALEKLPAPCQRALLLSRLHGKSYEEISQEMGVAVSTVEKYMIKALSFLRKYKSKEEKHG